MSQKTRSFTDINEEVLEVLERIFRYDITWRRQDMMAFHKTICELCCTVLIKSRRSQEAGAWVYFGLTHFLTIRLRSIVAELEEINNEKELLVAYWKSWKSYQASAYLLDIACGYLNENWIRREQQEGRDVYTIYRVAMITWKTDVFSPIDRSLINAIHYTVKKEIHSQHIKRSMVYTVLESIVDIFANDVNQSCSVLEKMSNIFQPKVLEFFEEEAKTLFQIMLKSDSRKELKHFVKCAILCVPSIEPDFCLILSAYLECLLKNELEKCGDYFQAILMLRKLPLLRAFADRIELLACVDLVYFNVINNITEGKKVGNPPEVLALHCHKLIQKKHSPEVLRNELKRIVEVLIFLNDENKECFTKNYFALLAKRRIDDTSASDENESLMISILRKDLRSDFEAMAKIYQNNMAESNVIQAKCQNFMREIGSKVRIDLGIKLFKVTQLRALSDGMRLPVELEQSVNELQIFWSKQYSSYRLYFDLRKSWGELIMNLGPQKCYTLKVNTLQMALLLQFNHQNICTIQKLAENVGASPETLIKEMHPLINRKLLIAYEDSASLTPTSSITVCRDYNSDRSLIKIIKAPAPRAPPTNTSKLKTKELDAAIVRIMEEEKQFKKTLLIFKLTKEQNLRSISIKLIKERIKHFLENKYLELSSDNKSLKLSNCTEYN